MNRNYKIKTKIFKWDVHKGSWFFIRIDKKTTENIKDNFGMYARGWGSLPANVTIGNSKWKTSIFPEKEGTYILPIKSQIRKAENIEESDTLTIYLEVAIESTEISAPSLSR